MAETKKFLDQEGVAHLWSKINMQDYPNNEMLISVIEAIDETKANKENVAFIDQEDNENVEECLPGQTKTEEVVFFEQEMIASNQNYTYPCEHEIPVDVQVDIYVDDVLTHSVTSYGSQGITYVNPTPDTSVVIDNNNHSLTIRTYDYTGLVKIVAHIETVMPTVKTGWLKDNNGEKFAPKTLLSQVQTSDGILLEDKIQADIDEFSTNIAFISEDDNEDIVIAETTSPYAGTIHRFTVEVNCAPMYIPEDNLGPEFADGTNMYTDYGVLIFPKSYTDTGKKTRLVISAHGGGGTVSADSSQAEYQSISQYLVANGYAVMDVNGLPEQYALDHGNLRLQDSVGSYIAIQSHIKAYNYAMDNFNFYPEVFLVGISEGGITTTNIVLHSHIPVLAQAGWSPVLDTYNQIWMDPWPWCSVNGPGAVLATVYGFDPIPDATSTKDRLKWTYDEKKIMGYNPMKCNVITGADGLEYRYYRCPVKFWHCMDDDTVSYEPTQAFIKSIQNAGGTAYLKLYETGGHETAYVGDPVPNPTGNTINLAGEEIEIKPVCEETYLFFKRFE